MRKSILEWIKAFVVAGLIVFVLQFFIGTTSVISVSMEPTLHEGEMLFLRKVGGIERGDVVTFRSNLKITASDLSRVGPLRKLLIHEGDPKILIKRVIAMPGEHIRIQEGKVYIDGELLDESAYLQQETFPDMPEVLLGTDEYFLMGDNRSASFDSRFDEIGLIQRKDIIGVVLVRLWPIHRLGGL